MSGDFENGGKWIRFCRRGYDLNQEREVLEIPKCVQRRVSKIVWSMVSNAEWIIQDEKCEMFFKLGLDDCVFKGEVTSGERHVNKFLYDGRNEDGYVKMISHWKLEQG